MRRKLTEEEKAFIADSKYPRWVVRENFRDKFGWIPSRQTIWNYSGGHRNFSFAKTRSEYSAKRNELLKNKENRDKFFKEHL